MNPGVEFFRGLFIHADGRVRICLYAFCHRIFHVDFGEKVCPFLSYCVFRESQPDCLDHALAEMADAPECDGVRFASLVKFCDLGAGSRAMMIPGFVGCVQNTSFPRFPLLPVAPGSTSLLIMFNF